MSVCVQYARPNSGQAESEIVGLDVAVDNFLSAWFKYGRQEKFICRPADLQSFEHFKRLARDAGIDAEARCISLEPRTPQQNMEKISCLFRPDPMITGPIWQRQQLKGQGYAACGLAHTMSGERIAQVLGELLLAPAANCDALICPSAAVRDAVHNLWEIYAEYLAHRSGGAFECPIETPVIPLGIDTEKFACLTAPEKRSRQRAALGAAEDEIVILFVGRLSFATKAHPLALMAAAERAAQSCKRKLRLVLFGYFKPGNMEPHFRDLAADIGKTARIEIVTNDDPRFPDGLWAAADIFASLSDNIQESFGLTPVEAMACGLPAVISNWDGYRGGVRDTEEGFLVPALAPPPEAGLAIAEHYYNDRNYGVALAAASQSTAIDIAHCTDAFLALAENDAARREMGAKGRARAEAIYDWRHIIKSYEALWEDLARKRKTLSPQSARGVPQGWQAAHPAFPNPWWMFASYPSGFLKPEDRLRVVMNADEITALLKHEMNFFVPDLLMPREALRGMIEVIRKAGTPRVADLLAVLPPTEHARAWRCVGWMLKLGICELDRKAL